MTPAARVRRCRIVMTPVSPVTGEPRFDAPILVYTVPHHRVFHLWKRLCHLNGGQWPVVNADGFSRYTSHLMTEDYYQAHKPAGQIVFRNRADRILEK